MSEIKRPLEGIKVVELATFIAAPCCARFLADLGAEVIKIEAPAGDPLRYTAVNEGRPQDQKENTTYDLENANKTCIALNTKSAAGREALEKLIAGADIFITNWRQSPLKKAGLDYDTLHAKYPALVYGFVSGYGEKGPDKDLPGFDFTAFFAVAGDKTVHQRGILFVQRFVVQTRLLQGILAPVGDEDVSAGDELFQRLASSGGLGVQGDTGLVGVLQIVGGVLLLILRTALVDGGVAQGIACGSLDLNDLGAQVGQEACAAGSGDEGSQFDDLDALQRAFDLTHGLVPPIVHYIFSMSRKVSMLVRACSNCTIWRSISTTVMGMPADSQAFLIIT